MLAQKKGMLQMNTEERAALETRLSTTMVTQWESFQDERRKFEEARDAAVERKREESAAKEKAKYDQLLDLQITEAAARQKSAKLRNKLLGLLVAILGTAGGSGAYVAIQPRPAKADPNAVKAAVESAERADKKRIEAVEVKVERLGSAQVEAQVAQSAGVEYIVDKIDAANPRSADKIPEPPEVEAARIRSESIKKKKRKAEVLGTKYDPFADLPKP